MVNYTNTHDSLNLVSQRSKSMAKTRKILVICPFPVGVAAGQRLKYEQYFQSWIENGYDVKVSSFLDLNTWGVAYKKGFWLQKLAGIFRGHMRRLRDIFRLNCYDCIYIHMWVTPFGSSFFERLFLMASKKVIFDLEDFVIYNQGIPQKEVINRVGRFFKNPNKQHVLIKNANHVITSSPALEDYCRAKNKYALATYITSSVDTDKFIPSSRGTQGPKVVIGWTGTFSSKPYLDEIKDVFQELTKKIQFKLHIICNFDYDLDGVDLKVIQWSRENEVSDLQALDIGIYPLPYNDWINGKSGLKAIQYMAFGIPTVASNTGNTPNIITHRVHGLLVDTKDDWIKSLESLVKDPLLRRSMGSNARNKCIAKYSISSTRKKYSQILNDLTSQ